MLKLMQTVQKTVYYSVVSGDVVRECASPEINQQRRRVKLHAWRRPVWPRWKRDTEQVRELIDYRDRFDLGYGCH